MLSHPKLGRPCTARLPAACLTRRRPAAAWRAAAAAAPDALPEHAGLVKVCGVTTEEDAELAAAAGAHLIGMILWPHAKRSVGADAARRIAAAARRHGATPVGVFVDEDAATIAAVCAAAGVRVAQLHGDGARAALAGLPPELAAVYVLHAAPDGALLTPPPPRGARPPRWLLLDSAQGGSGQAFDWEALDPPAGASTHGWLLAGGLGPDNVARAVAAAAPGGVDVSSGVCGPDGLRKDAGRVRDFVARAAGAFAEQRRRQRGGSG